MNYHIVDVSDVRDSTGVVLPHLPAIKESSSTTKLSI